MSDEEQVERKPTWDDVQTWRVDVFLDAWAAGDLAHLGLLPPGPVVRGRPGDLFTRRESDA